MQKEVTGARCLVVGFRGDLTTLVIRDCQHVKQEVKFTL